VSIPRFAAYAAAFEKAYETDDWSEVGSFFAPAAVYEVSLDPPIGGRFEGRDAILAYFKRVLDGFDRRFASREIALLEGPVEKGDQVSLRGSARYRAVGVPDLVLELEETATFAGDHIVRLEDTYAPEVATALEAYLAEHAARLGLGMV
jgi:hypothetical protein